MTNNGDQDGKIARSHVKKTFNIPKHLADRFEDAVPKGRNQTQIIKELMESYVAHRAASDSV